MEFDFKDSIEALPQELSTSEHWASMRNEILASLRKDAEGLPMTTSQLLIMERMATFYVVTRKREADPEFKQSANDLRQNNQQWLAMTAEFNKQITLGEDKRRHAMLKDIQKIVLGVLMMVEDDKLREDLRKRFVSGFAEAGY